MAIIKPFKGIRPPVDMAAQVASRPYDVLSSDEAREEAAGNPYSLLHIIKPEIDLDVSIDVHSPQVYEKARENFKKFRDSGWLIQDEKDHLYIYAQTMDGRTQYGLVGCASVDDYLNGVIKKHELTRPDKEEDRMKHVRINRANIEPVFFTYPSKKEIDAIVDRYVNDHLPIYDFVASDGVGHHFWMVDDDDTIQALIDLFGQVPATYVADGHHRTAAAALVGNEMKEKNSHHTGHEEYNFFLAVHFPDNQLKIIDYNRVIKDLNGLSKEGFLEAISERFVVEKKGPRMYKPIRLHNFSMYLDGEWYSLTARERACNDDDPIGILDVTILTQQVLDPILGITDLRRSTRIDFVGGIRGLGELKKRVDSGEMAVAFALFPVTLKQLINIADSNQIMPPKTTWFEPKLRSGLVIHSLE